MLEPGTVGGILNIVAAYLLYRGNVMYSTLLYLLTDLSWFTLAIYSKDYIGAVFIAIGFLFGLGVFIKMNLGIFRKQLKVDEGVPSSTFRH